jgi:TolA-binding protein
MEEARKIAERFFEHAVTVAETRNFDYAIELYLQGLAKDPQAVEKGHKPLREFSLKRLASGGKKAGFIESLKRSTTNKKDPILAMINSEYFLAKDPLNVLFAESMVKNADQAELPETLLWALGICLELTKQEKKLNLNRLLMLKNLYEKLGDHYEQANKPEQAIASYEGGLEALDVGVQTEAGRNLDFGGLQRDLAGKLTIMRGKYERAESFRESIRDADGQKQLHDQGRIIKGEEMHEKAIRKAREDFEANSTIPGKLNTLVDALLQRGKAEDENEAISLLNENFKTQNQYSYKMRADDVHIRQLTRDIHAVKAKVAAQKEPDPALQAQYAQAVAKLDTFELQSYKERVEQYPTDAKLKFEYARRLYKAKQYDEAIPIFQAVTLDPRFAGKAKYHIGACFFQKEWYAQAIDVIKQAIESHENPGDSISKEMYYILARSHENAGQKDEARKAYNKLIQWDFNYRDVRQRIDKLGQ